jgi:Zn-dependent protease
MWNSFQIGKLFGISVRIDYTWFIVFALVAGSLGFSYFPELYPGWSSAIYWLMGVATALIFFCSVLAHEMAHSLVSRSRGVPVHSITLFIFGGVARISDEPKGPGSEFWMALAGPATSIGLGFIFGALYLATRKMGTLLPAMFELLAYINLVVAVFNLIPGFPLDGGRILRSIIWKITGDLKKSTRIASVMGRIIAYLLILLGASRVLAGNLLNGMWIAFIGWFLQNAAASSYRQLALREMLQGAKVKDVMMRDCVGLSKDLTIQELVDNYILSTVHRCFPVMDNDNVIGIITLHRVKDVPREKWKTTRIEDAMTPLDEMKAIHPDDDLYTTMRQMTAEDEDQFPVMENGQLTGMLARDDLARFINARTELGV